MSTLTDAIDMIVKRLPPQVSDRARALAAHVIESQDAEDREDVADWARRIAESVRGATD